MGHVRKPPTQCELFAARDGVWCCRSRLNAPGDCLGLGVKVLSCLFMGDISQPDLVQYNCPKCKRVVRWILEKNPIHCRSCGTLLVPIAITPSRGNEAT